MSTVEIIGYSFIILTPLVWFIIAFVVALGKKPGYRRRQQIEYLGEERRCPERENCPFKHLCGIPPELCKKLREQKVIDKPTIIIIEENKEIK